MSLFEDVMALAVQMPMAERERVGRALGLNVHSKGAGKTLTLNQFVSQPTPQSSDAWRKAETGHAVVDTRAAEAAGSGTGARAIAGMWPLQPNGEVAAADLAEVPLASTLPANTPVIVDTSTCFALTEGGQQALAFWSAPGVDIRITSATYVSLLSLARSEAEVRRLQAFVQEFAVLSLGPVASSRAVEMMTLHGVHGELQALDAFVAATALAYNCPLISAHPQPFLGIAELSVARPY